MVNIGVLVSGSGTNLQSIIDEIEAGRLDASIKVVVSNKADAYALERARKHNIPVAVVRVKDFPGKEAFDAEVLRVLKEYGVELVVLAGFMRIITRVLLDAFHMKVMNIHPSLLPSFPGLEVQKAALEYGVKFSGCTVHFVDDGVDTGPVIVQAVVPVKDEDTVESLSKRILAEEHRIYTRAIQLYSEGRLEVRGRRVFVRDAKAPSGAVENPGAD
ncbi:MAG: phosphoribosylglycinamide formyltransferase [Deltaproteobacteria bacterium]|nr:phosphoribosylglycinamide formyltransferase [Deltaproteobacteria bacterium]MCL4872717.1 phosphoribosylglycinamide formyltransferase [bacterium]